MKDFIATASLSLYTLTINNTSMRPDVLRFHGREALSEPFRWDIEFTTDLPVKDELLNKFASLRMRSGKVVHGVITRMEWLSQSADQTHYRVFLESRLALMKLTCESRIFQNLSAPELAEQLLRQHGFEGPDFDFRLKREYPARELITQWQESDLQFLQRILAEVGIWFRSEMNAVTEQETLIFADSQQGYQFDVALPYAELSGLHDGERESVWGVRTWHNVVTGSVRKRDYNYRQAGEPCDADAAVSSGATTTGGHYRYIGPYLNAGEEDETESGRFYARIAHERELKRADYVHLFSNASHLTPGAVLEPQGKVIRALQNGVVMTLVTFIASRDSRLHVSVWGMPYSEHFCFRPATVPRPEIVGTHPARIESRNADDIYAHLDETGRYRVKLDVDRLFSESGYSYLWVRLAKPYAGRDYGFHAPLIQGTEVGIAFDGGDPDRPYIAHAFHDSEHPDVVSRDNRSQNILRTPAGNELRMEDKRGSEHIALTTEYGKTQLNQGHITDRQDKPRGSGFELHTDEHGVIRVAKGLFVTADGQTKGVGEVLDMATTLREIEIAIKQIEQLKLVQEQVDALIVDINVQREMFSQRLQPLNELIHFSAPEGVAFTSGEHLQLAAAENIHLNAGGDISAGAMGNVNLMAGEKVGLFAHQDKLSLIAGEGPIKVEAQNAAMKIMAAKKLSMSAEQDILFASKKRIVLIGGGSYLKLEAGRIEYGTEAKYLRKTMRTHKAVAREMPVEMPVMPLADRFAEQAGRRALNPLIYLGDAPGSAGHAHAQRGWQIVIAQSKSEAMSTDEIVMRGESDSQGRLLSAEQQTHLAELAKQHADRLWLVSGQRVLRVRLSIIPSTADEAVKEACALDALGYHRAFNRASGSEVPFSAFTQCIRKEQQTEASPSVLKEEK